MLAVYWKNNSQFVGNNQTCSLESSRFQWGLYKLRLNYNITAVSWFFSTFFGSNAHKRCLPRSYYIGIRKVSFHALKGKWNLFTILTWSSVFVLLKFLYESFIIKNTCFSDRPLIHSFCFHYICIIYKLTSYYAICIDYGFVIT